ncbi:uncharacterized protein LOC127869685 [Dreissena polymorpha]|uniref:uncharacterized protein LOC127869685 n=1 Tax=Dreissena polymorpha TaxID=45954 RepID=UPI002264389F|nr:uncharacterized protein LOC127869685 [Dreissena polymorpha]
MLKSMKIPPLQERRKAIRLIFFFKVVEGLVPAMPSQDFLTPVRQSKRQRSKATDAMVHYSFDYCQQVFYPQQAQAVGPMYFKTPRKCQCFGVCCESSGTQIFYLVDEAFQSVGKGANSVTSMLHHHFSHLGYGERNVVLHMDNCSGQNKNNAVIGYGMWRVLTGLHDSIEFSTMEAGHTKFSPDWHFGLWKELN